MICIARSVLWNIVGACLSLSDGEFERYPRALSPDRDSVRTES